MIHHDVSLHHEVIFELEGDNDTDADSVGRGDA
jgi:hypothetical protein